MTGSGPDGTPRLLLVEDDVELAALLKPLIAPSLQKLNRRGLGVVADES